MKTNKKEIKDKLDECLVTLENNEPISEKRLHAGLGASIFLNDIESAKKFIANGAICCTEDIRLPIINNNIEMVKLLLEQDIEIYKEIIIDKKEYTLLMLAIIYKNIQIIKLLLEHDADVDNEIFKKLAILDEPEILKLFIEYGADVNMDMHLGDDMPYSLLLWAIDDNNTGTAKILIEAGADLNFKDKRGKTALSHAVEKQNIELVKLLLKQKVTINNESSLGIAVLSRAILYNNKEMIGLLIEAGADVNGKVYNASLLIYSMMFGEPETTELLIENDADVNEKVNNLSPLAVSIMFDRIETTELLINHGANVNGKFNNVSLLLFSIMLGKMEATELLIKHGANVNEKFNDVSSLASSIMFDKPETTELLIENGANVNEKFDDASLLMFSIILDRLEATELLVKHGADIGWISEDGDTFLQSIVGEEFPTSQERQDEKLTIRERSIEIKKEIEDMKEIGKESIMDAKRSIKNAKSNVDETNKNTLYLEMDNDFEMDFKSIDNALKEVDSFYKNISYNIKNMFSDLKNVSYELNYIDKLEVLKNILKHDIDINHINKLGETALDIAEKMDEVEIIEELEKHGAIRNLTLNQPKKLVKTLKNFTKDTPIKYTTHSWDFGTLQDEYKNFDGFLDAAREQFDGFSNELKELSPNLYKKIYTFLFETNPDENYSWCSKENINIGWTSLKGLKEWCDSGNKPQNFDVSSLDLIVDNEDISTFGEIINLFKQEIEIRRDFRNLSKIFQDIQRGLGKKFTLKTKKLDKQFYADTQKLNYVISKIFEEIKKRDDFGEVDVFTKELEDDSIELHIVHKGSYTPKNAKGMLNEVEDGDFADIKESLSNMCDWSIENSFDSKNYRINYLKSKNINDEEELSEKVDGFTHILRFYTA